MKTPKWQPTILFQTELLTVQIDYHEEHLDPQSHFMGECGWTREQYSKIKNFYWFSFEVSAKYTTSNDISVEFSEFLGACCHESKTSFLETETGGYLPQMVAEVRNQLQKWLRNEAVNVTAAISDLNKVK